MDSRHRCVFWPAVFFCVFVVGCSKPVVDEGPSYAELVVTYNAELEALDRLEAKREKLIEQFAAATAPTASADTLTALEGLLKTASDLKDSTNPDTSDPNELLENAAARTEGAEEIAGQLLEGLLGGESDAAEPEPTPEQAAAAAERKAAFEAELAKLDTEISKQQQRVERARQARDAAEAKSQSSRRD
jgi:hypothetical protein